MSVEWTVGRAGMLYADLLPGRAGGRLLVNRIRIPEGGPVGDWVHFHRVGFQVIVVLEGRVRLVYEDQGPPFWAGPGDLVLQPPTIRHRVLETESGLEVLELVSPADHETEADPAMELPTEQVRYERLFGGQRFAWDQAVEAEWRPGPIRVRQTEIDAATGGAATMAVLRADAGGLVGVGRGGLAGIYVWSGSITVGRDPVEAGAFAVVGRSSVRMAPGSVAITVDLSPLPA